ncbi:lamin tail domain-containing protein [Streptomyces sp. NBC_01142]|uniref:lamin tail domain-containing protein n=1 Tax=Streptomyces sp. NBC_01142 TaxID=2975865 RepID=UPI002255F253|nr:lamin tail domain-containing protein [Streptomyces sp. NBC_01142]MCX4818976.1 lamin tail domain-containing protein [Streptomyces sp. NBC_01142]
MSASSTARRIAATVLAAGAVVSAVALPASASAHDGDRHRQQPRVEISRVQADSPGRDNGSNRSLNAEWVEITNNTRRAVDLDGWTLRNRDGDRYRFDDVRVARHATVRIHTGVGRDTRTDLYQDRRHYVWDNRSDKATLRNDRGRTVDTETWGRHHRR